ncbi:MAG: alanyl-tRNA editing protein [Lachnospiraceae bacterium]|nr:alanyl-tRNA editing protein [Lachnospiraceae bacterium]
METIKLYDEDAYAIGFEATVLSCVPSERNKTKCYAVVLDRTLFFPEEGGQSPDQGEINGHEVIDVQISQNVITHYVLEEPFEINSTVHGLIDFKHRFSNMQQHSGEHIFSGLVSSMYGFNNVGFHLSDNSVTMDYDGVLTANDIEILEKKVNEAIYKNIEIVCEYPDAATLVKKNYRCKKELSGAIRIVTIPGYDCCACCAPHVKKTGEIGVLKVIRLQNYKGGVRLHILCGERAVNYFRESLNLIDSLTDVLTTGRENLKENITSMKDELQRLSSKLAVAKQDLLLKELANLPESEKDVTLFREKTDSFIMRNVLNRLVEKHEGFCSFFSGSDEDGWTYFIGSRTKDCRDVQKKLSKISARGGGKPEMISGSVKATKEAIMNALA